MTLNAFVFKTPFQRLARGMEDLTGDGGVLKRIVRKGTGPVVPEGATVRCMYIKFVISLLVCQL